MGRVVVSDVVMKGGLDEEDERVGGGVVLVDGG